MQAQRRLAREQGDAVVAFLAMKVYVVAQGLDLGERELLVADLGFLQADDVGLVLFDQRRQLVGPGTQAIDVERDDLHGSTILVKPRILADIGGVGQRGDPLDRLLTCGTR
ncbi:hypothetical protein D3C81_1559560 [compost metagenome]